MFAAWCSHGLHFWKMQCGVKSAGWISGLSHFPLKKKDLSDMGMSHYLWRQRCVFTQSILLELWVWNPDSQDDGEENCRIWGCTDCFWGPHPLYPWPYKRKKNAVWLSHWYWYLSNVAKSRSNRMDTSYAIVIYFLCSTSFAGCLPWKPCNRKTVVYLYLSPILSRVLFYPPAQTLQW